MDKKLINQAVLLGMGVIGGYIIYKALVVKKGESKSSFGGKKLKRFKELVPIKSSEVTCMCANNDSSLGGYFGTGSSCPCMEGYYDVTL